MPASSKSASEAISGARGEDRRVAQLPGGDPGGGAELRLHAKARRLLVPPPAGEPRAGQRAVVLRARLRARVALVHEAAADRAGAGVQVLVAAPHGEVCVRRRAASSGTLPIECARSKPAMHPCACAARAMRARSNAWPVRNCTPGHSTSAISSPCARRQSSMSSGHCVFTRRAGASSMSVASGSRPCQAIWDATA